MSASTVVKEKKAPVTKVALVVLSLITFHHLFSSIVNSYTEWDYFINRPPEYRVIQAHFGNKLGFLGLIFLAVVLNYRDTRKYIQDILRLYVGMTVIALLSPYVNGRWLHIVAPNSPGNVLPKVWTMLGIIGLISLHLEQKRLNKEESSDSKDNVAAEKQSTTPKKSPGLRTRKAD
jgi:hypothetical protein